MVLRGRCKPIIEIPLLILTIFKSKALRLFGFPLRKEYFSIVFLKDKVSATIDNLISRMRNWVDHPKLVRIRLVEPFKCQRHFLVELPGTQNIIILSVQPVIGQFGQHFIINTGASISCISLSVFKLEI